MEAQDASRAVPSAQGPVFPRWEVNRRHEPWSARRPERRQRSGTSPRWSYRRLTSPTRHPPLARTATPRAAPREPQELRPDTTWTEQAHAPRLTSPNSSRLAIPPARARGRRHASNRRFHSTGVQGARIRSPQRPGAWRSETSDRGGSPARAIKNRPVTRVGFTGRSPQTEVTTQRAWDHCPFFYVPEEQCYGSKSGSMCQ